MCILSYIPTDVDIDVVTETHLWNGGINNPDGHGWAIASNNGALIMGRSLDLNEAIDGFIKARSVHNGPGMFHSRWATHGSVRLGNCHPFLVGKSHKTALAHNGILPKQAHPAKGDDRSDTAILAAQLMPKQWKRLDKPSVQKSLTEWCGKGNKLVILTTDTRYRNNAYLINENAGQWDEATGIWHSNGDYRYGYATKTVGYYSGITDKYDNDIDPTQCVYCNMRVNYQGMCTVCSTCQDCLEPGDDCQCWSSSRSIADIAASIDPHAPIPFTLND